MKPLAPLLFVLATGCVLVPPPPSVARDPIDPRSEERRRLETLDRVHDERSLPPPPKPPTAGRASGRR
jgi:hypothetical protein